MNMNGRDTAAAEVVVSNICRDFDRVVVFRSSPSQLEAAPFERDREGHYTETEHDLREYPAVQAVVSGRVDADHSITWHVPFATD